MNEPTTGDILKELRSWRIEMTASFERIDECIDRIEANLARIAKRLFGEDNDD